MKTLKDKERFFEPNLEYTFKNYISMYPKKDVKQTIIELNELINSEKSKGYKFIQIDILEEFISKKIGNWKK